MTTATNAEPHRAPADLRFPVGPYQKSTSITANLRLSALEHLAELPGNLRNAVDELSPDQMDTPYRPGGWTVRQLVHHIADSHMQAFARIRFALTEDFPTIKPYDEKAWAELHDRHAPAEWSLELIESLHARWVMLLQSLNEGQWQRGYTHPVNGRTTVEQAVLLYGWHSRHHTSHITHLRRREGW